MDLRKVFEAELGDKISNRSWDRWKTRLQLPDCSDDSDLIAQVRVAAALRRQNKSLKVTRLMVLFELNTLRKFPTDIVCTGEELYRSAQEALGKEIYPQYMYRWGRKIKVPFRVGAVYSSKDLKKWAAFLFPRSALVQDFDLDSNRKATTISWKN
ncbi:MAG TPA: hypothetical protein V6D29_13190 [Leptolyngbyaceae cyanobacterium]